MATIKPTIKKWNQVKPRSAKVCPLYPLLPPTPWVATVHVWVALPRKATGCTFCAQRPIRRLLPAEVVSSEAESRQTQPGSKSKISKLQNCQPTTAFLLPSLRGPDYEDSFKSQPHSQVSKGCPNLCPSHSQAVEQRSPSIHNFPFFLSPSQSPSQKHLWGGGCPSLHSTVPKCIATAWAGKALRWQTRPVHCKITVLVSLCEH